MIEYATLADVKAYLEIAQDVNNHDTKLSIILSAGNKKCEKYTGEPETDEILKYSICKYVEYNFTKKAGVASEKEEGYDISFARDADGQYSDVPPEVLDIWKDYVDEDDEQTYSVSVDLI